MFSPKHGNMYHEINHFLANSNRNIASQENGYFFAKKWSTSTTKIV
jgi:hypothetical protein